MNFEEIDHHRDAGDIRLGGDEVEERHHRLFGIQQAFVHVDVDDLRAVRDLVARHLKGGGVIAGRDQLAEFRRTRDVGAFADIDEGNGRRQLERLKPGEPQARLDRRDRAGSVRGDGSRDRCDMIGRGAAAAADDVDETGGGKLADQARHVFRALVILAEFVGQSGVRIGANQSIGDAADVGDVRAKIFGAERAIESDGDRPRVAHRIPERLGQLPRQQPAGLVGDGAGDHHRHVDAAFLANLGDGVERGLGVKRVEDGLDQQQVGTAVEQALDLLAIGVAQIVEGDGAVAGIRNVGRDRRGAVGRADRAGDEAGLAVLGADTFGGGAREFARPRD